MKKIIFMTVLGLVLMIALQGLAQPLIEVIGGEEYDFGIAKVNQKLKHTFVLKNIGTDTLHIKSVKGT